jgi:hypothetical protein
MADAEDERFYRRASSGGRYAAASRMFAGGAGVSGPDGAIASLIRRHAAQLAELNRRAAAAAGDPGSRECTLM